MESGLRRELEREEEDLLERIEDSNVDDEMQDNGRSPIGVEAGTAVQARVKDDTNEATPERRLVSYKDIVLQLNGEDEELRSDEESWMEVQKREEEEEEEEDDNMGEDVPGVQIDPLYPLYHFSAKQHRDDCKKWRSALIIKLMGKKISNRFLMARLLRLWCLVGKFEVIDLDNGYIPVNFHENHDFHCNTLTYARVSLLQMVLGEVTITEFNYRKCG